MNPLQNIHGRGAASNPQNRFERLAVQIEYDDKDSPPPEDAPRTEYLRATSRTVIT